MSRATRATVLTIAYMCLGGLVAIAVLAPQVVLARRDADRLRAHERDIAAQCTFRPDGSATCPAGVFHIDGVKK